MEFCFVFPLKTNIRNQWILIKLTSSHGTLVNAQLGLRMQTDKRIPVYRSLQISRVKHFLHNETTSKWAYNSIQTFNEHIIKLYNGHTQSSSAKQQPVFKIYIKFPFNHAEALLWFCHHQIKAQAPASLPCTLLFKNHLPGVCDWPSLLLLSPPPHSDPTLLVSKLFILPDTSIKYSLVSFFTLHTLQCLSSGLYFSSIFDAVLKVSSLSLSNFWREETWLLGRSVKWHFKSCTRLYLPRKNQ